MCARRIKLGFDRARARELQWLFTTHRIAPREREHVMDTFFGFAEALGVHDRVLRWDIPMPGEARHYAAQIINDRRPTLVISPCSSHARRNWRAEYYAQVADHAARAHGMRVVLTGGPTNAERRHGARRSKARFNSRSSTPSAAIRCRSCWHSCSVPTCC